LRTLDLPADVLRAHLCVRTADGRGLSMLLREPTRCPDMLAGLCRSILFNLGRGILNRLNGLGLCLRILLRQPGLEPPEQGFG